jgi:succinate dehydrogenase flavin-adding protein (antitoxin of CptAB toxin-antitoxin module)
MKYLYIVDYWVPFPSSEYGGLINLIAESDTEAFEILANEEEFDSTYTNRIMEKVVTAQKFELVNEYESGILEAFTT